MLQIDATFTVGKIENGFIVSHVQASRSIHVSYDFLVARQIEAFMHDEAVARMEAQDALSGEAAAPEPATSTAPMQHAA